MLDILRDYLNNFATPELTQAVETASNAFDRIGHERYEPAFEEILMTTDLDPDNNVQHIVGVVRKVQDEILKEFGITLMPEESMDMSSEFIVAICDLQNNVHKVDIIAACQGEGLPEERIAEALSLVMHRSAEEINAAIETVNDSLLTKIVELVNEDDTHDRPDENEVIGRNYRIAKYKDFMEFTQKEDSFVQRLLDEGVDVGYPFSLYCARMGREFEALAPVDAAFNLVAMALISEDAVDQPLIVIRQNLESVIADPMALTKVDIAVNDFLVRFAAYESK